MATLGLATISGCASRATGPSQPTDSPDYDLPYRLRVENQSGQPLEIEVTLTELTDAGEPSEESTTESYTLDPDSQVSLDHHIEPSTDYKVTVSVQGGATDSWYLYPYSAITVEIKSADHLEPFIIEV